MIAIDKLNFKFKFTTIMDAETVPGPSESGAYIYGLFVEGCRYIKIIWLI